MNIAVDIGNTCLKFGVFAPDKENELVGHWMMPTDETGWVNGTFLKNMTCVGMLTNKITPSDKWAPGMENPYPDPLTWKIAQTGSFPLKKFKTEILALRPKDVFKTVQRRQIPLKRDVDAPEQVGIDRLLAAYSAVKKYGDAPMLVVDVGTAITVDVVQNQTFCGGAILPGLTALSEAYPRISAKLPHIGHDAMIKIGLNYPGGNTKSAVFNGIYWGTIGAIRQFYQMYPHQERALLILTGGDAKFFLPALTQMVPKGHLLHHDTLVLEGINLIP
jgi:pantothenate kinase type III